MSVKDTRLDKYIKEMNADRKEEKVPKPNYEHSKSVEWQGADNRNRESVARKQEESHHKSQVMMLRVIDRSSKMLPEDGSHSLC